MNLYYKLLYFYDLTSVNLTPGLHFLMIYHIYWRTSFHQVLLDMHHEQIRSEEHSTFNIPDEMFPLDPPFLGGGGSAFTLPSPPSHTKLESLHMTKCIAVVTELPYVSFVKEYLTQVSKVGVMVLLIILVIISNN